MKMLLQALSILLLCPICVSVSAVMFSGFTEGGTYYTNGDTVTLVTCNAAFNGQVITNLTWYYESTGSDVDTGSSVLRFEDVVNETVWGDTRLYYCRATYEDNVGVTMSTNSSRIAVIVQYNTTITISYNNTIHVRNQTVRESVPIPVMTENVELRCGVESAEWSYNSLYNQPNPLTIDLFTVQFSTDFTCNDSLSREVLSVTLVAVGSGVWQQESGVYVELAEEVVTLTEDLSLVCVTSVVYSRIEYSGRSAWYFKNETGSLERQTDNANYDSNKGFLTLNLPQSLPANRTGYYLCITNERNVSSGNTTVSQTYTIKIVLPTETTTSTISTPTLTTTSRTTSPSSSSITTHVTISQSTTLATVSNTTPLITSQPTALATVSTTTLVTTSQPTTIATISTTTPVKTSQPTTLATVSTTAPVITSQPTTIATISTTTPVKTSQPTTLATVSTTAPVITSQPTTLATISTTAPVKTSQPITLATISTTTPVKTSQPTTLATVSTTKPVITSQPTTLATVSTTTPVITSQPNTLATVSTTTPFINPQPTTIATISTTTPVIRSTARTSVSPSPHSVSLSFSYTPEHEVVFVGVDDVTLLCVASSMTSSDLSVSVRDERRELSRKTGSGPVSVQYRVNNFTAGFLLYTCVANTSTSSVEETLTLVVREIYEQAVTRLTTSDISEDSLRLEWNVMYEANAEEEFIISINNLNESTGWEEVGRTSNTFYTLNQLIPGNHYLIRVRVTNRLNATSSLSINYIHTITTTQPFNLSILIPVISVISVLALAVLSMLLAAVLLIVMIVVRRRRRRKLGYSKAVEDEAPLEISGPSPYANLSSDNHTASSMKVPVLPRKKAAYEKLLTADRSADGMKMSVKNYWYMSLDFLEVGSGQNESSSEDDNPMDETELSQYINLNTIKHLTTEGKYANDPHATLVPLLGYKHHLSAMLKAGQLEAEYEGLGGDDLRYECNAAIDKANEGKNKYRLIYPYDRSRVTLHGDSGSDYINASFIPGHHVPDTFIAAQAPKPQTVDAFWQMVWQQRVATVVMLTRVVELGKEKSVRYWPEHAGTSDTYGDITVVLQKEDQCIGYATRELVLTDATGTQTKATQYHFTAWPDHDVPQLYNKLLAFTRLVKRSVNENRSPILVHCSAGVGRSGTFIALYNLMEAVGNEEAVSVYRIVNEMREYRPRMVQTFSQYRFIHLALLELLFGSTSIPSEDFTDTYKMFLQSQDEDSADLLKEQFDELCFQSDHSFPYPTTAAALPQNVEKNPVEGVVPYDDKRVVLYSPNWDCEYVNASYIGDYDLIATPLPTSSSIQEFLQLIFQLENPLVVVLATKGEYQRIIERSSSRVCYWLEENGTKDYEGFRVKTEKTQKSNYLIQHKMLVSSNYDNKAHPFTQFISQAWEVNGFVTEALAILNLLDQISIQKQNSPRKKLLICCSDGIGKTGVLLTAYRAISEIQSVGSVDVFQIVKQLRNFRRNMVPTIEHFISCYSLINEYCQMNL